MPSLITPSKPVADASQLESFSEADPVLCAYRDEDSERHAIWQDATPAFREVLVQVARWFVEEHRLSLLRRYELAELVKKIADDETRGGRRYGVYAMDHLTTFFGWEKSTLYRALQIAKVFSRSDIEALSRQRMRDGRPLCYMHVHYLSDVRDAARRQAILEQTLQECWTVDNLAFEVHQIRKREAPAVADHRGRPLAIPRTLDDVIRQQERAADDFLNRAEKVWDRPEHGLLSKLMDLSHDQCTEERAARLKAHADKLQRLADQAQARAAEARQAYEEVARFLGKGTEKAQEAVVACSRDQGEIVLR